MARGSTPPPESIETEALDREIGARLRNIRNLRGLTQAELGHVLGVSLQQVHKYECGASRISTSALILLARALDVPLCALLGEEDKTASCNIDWKLLSADGAHLLLQAVNQIGSPEDRRLVLELARELAYRRR